MPPEVDLFAAPCGSVTAPAGCGKTQLIVDTLAEHTAAKPILVLTHTNAGVAALRARLAQCSVRASAYRISTLDGFAMRLASRFPLRSGISANVLALDDPKRDYPAIRGAVGNFIHAGDINDALRATYSRLLVDEYQDCNVAQHRIVVALSKVFPTCVLGDPMQAIFGFGGNQLVDWGTDVESSFPPIGALTTPWRWRRAGHESLGQWLLNVRANLQAGAAVNLETRPTEVEWVALRPETEEAQKRAAARTRPLDQDGRVLIIGDALSARSRHLLTSHVPEATSVETVDLGDLIAFAREFDPSSDDPLGKVISFAALVMTGVGAANLVDRVAILKRGTAHTPPTAVEAEALAMLNAPSIAQAANLLETLRRQPSTRVFRPAVLNCCLSAMRVAASGSCTLLAAALQARERNRHFGRPLSRRAVGSTLLLKGLEAEVAVVLEPGKMNAQHLYVALTRGSQQLVICSRTAVLTPALRN